VRLTVYTDYSLRVLLYLALKDDGPATIAEIAASYGISRTHLMKVAHQLGLAGYVTTVRGNKGGLRLARSPNQIVLGEVVRRTEPDLALAPCFAQPGAACVVDPSCVLKRALQDALHAFLSTLDAVTLADLIRPKAQLRDLLSIAARDEQRSIAAD
jgi:Rrf2 family transcriptional regulator, nitric oxide-sensitive transcriptional repressor